MNEDLQRYLNDHLAGSHGAVGLLDDLATRQILDPDREFFLHLKESVENDQDLLKRLLHDEGMEQSRSLQAAGTLAAAAGRLKLLWEGLEPGGLGLFEALELLVLGIEGKRLLWVMLRGVAPHVASWQDVHFDRLELEAIRQRDAVESRRLEAGREVFTSHP